MSVHPMPKPTLPGDAQDALMLLQRYVDTFYPGARVDLPLFRVTSGAIDGFALHHDGGLSLMYVDAMNLGTGGQWVLQMCAVLAVEVTDVTEALLWTNDQNRNSTVDRYYCALSHDGASCAIAADTTVPSILLAGFANQRCVAIMNMLTSLAKNTLYSASVESKNVLRTCGGRPLTTSESDLFTLLAVSAP
jgi:hypothetical protein